MHVVARANWTCLKDFFWRRKWVAGWRGWGGFREGGVGSGQREELSIEWARDKDQGRE